jgi:hypothetical protein
MLGLANDDPDLLRAGAVYIERTNVLHAKKVA